CEPMRGGIRAARSTGSRRGPAPGVSERPAEDGAERDRVGRRHGRRGDRRRARTRRDRGNGTSTAERDGDGPRWRMTRKGAGEDLRWPSQREEGGGDEVGERAERLVLTLLDEVGVVRVDGRPARHGRREG